MKYTLEGFNQAELVALGLNGTDAYILRWFVDFQATGRMKPTLMDGETYYWVKYQAIIEDLPALGITSHKSVARRMMRLVEAGVLKKQVEKHGGGTFTCFKVGDGLVQLLAHPPDKIVQSVDKIVQPLDKKVQPEDKNAAQGTQMSGGTAPKCPVALLPNVHPNNSSTRDSSTRDRDIVETAVSTSTSKSLNSIPYTKIVEFLNQQVGKDFRHATKATRRLIQARWREGFREEDFRRVIMTKTNQWKGDPKMTGFLRPDTLFGTKFEGYRQEWRALPPEKRPLTDEEVAEKEQVDRIEKILYRGRR